MRRLIVILLLVGQSEFLTAQNKAKDLKITRQKGDLNCVYKPKYSSVERRKFYPFNVYHNVKIGSFRYHKDIDLIKGFKTLNDSLLKSRLLTYNEIDALTDILYNNHYKKKPNYGSVIQCFYPRNAILFYDEAGNVRESILLCFHCDRHENSADRINFGDNCSQKMEKLRLFFISLGFNYGTDRSIDSYPGENNGEFNFLQQRFTASRVRR